MRHRIKKIPTLSNKSHHLLHSDKSTNTALRFGPLSGRKLSNLQRPVLFSPEKRGFLEKMMSYAHHPIQTLNTYFYNTNGKIGNKLNFLYSSKISTIPLVLSAFGLLLVLGMVVFPLVGDEEKVYAANTVPDPNFSIQLILNNTVQTEQELDSGVVGYIANNFTINTTSTASYSIYLQPDTENGFSNKLIGQQYKQEITGVGSNVGVSDFTNNTWGYGLTNTNDTTTANNALTYSTIPDGSTPIKTVTNPDNGNDVYKLVFAAKIGDDKPADHYQSQAILSVMASPVQIANLDSIDYMQEMTTDICTNTAIGATNTLTDTRDNATYTVGKLSDGKCWMTQNLRIVNKTITSADSDVTSNYTIPASSLSGFSDNTASNVYYNNDTTYGAYYTWCAATAGCKKADGTNPGANENAASSICPKGWRLPTGGSSEEFEALNDIYPKGVGYPNSSNPGWDSTNNGTWLGATNTAFGGAFFPASGSTSKGKLNYVGQSGSYLSSTASTAAYAYSLFLASSVISPSSSNPRYGGYSVRCVAR